MALLSQSGSKNKKGEKVNEIKKKENRKEECKENKDKKELKRKWEIHFIYIYFCQHYYIIKA